MLSLTIGAVAIALTVCMIGFGFYLLTAEQKRGQHQADTLALSLAQSLNSSDRIGQINNVVARCRELVYVSRVNDSMSQQNGGVMQPLAMQLLTEARASALLVESERRNQANLITSNVKYTVDQYNLNSPNNFVFSIPLFQTYQPRVQDLNFGYVDKVESNVENLNVITDLRNYDQQAGYFQAGSNLYHGNINARLPNPDGDLNFKISSLPADVQNSVSPARLANSGVFKSTTPVYKDGSFCGGALDQLPSTVQMTVLMPVSIKGGIQQVEIGSVAQTSGANPAP